MRSSNKLLKVQVQINNQNDDAINKSQSANKQPQPRYDQIQALVDLKTASATLHVTKNEEPLDETKYR